METIELNSMNPYRLRAESVFLCGKLLGFDAECLVIENYAILPAICVVTGKPVDAANLSCRCLSTSFWGDVRRHQDGKYWIGGITTESRASILALLGEPMAVQKFERIH